MKTNPILLEVFKNRLSSVAEEMGVVLNRTAFSPNIKERRDFSCAIFNSKGEMVTQAANIPVHLGSMPLSVKAALQNHNFSVGDMVMLNDPFQGGTHLPDITLVAPVFTGGEKPAFYVANRAHHADVGGMSPGSMPLSTSIFQEGIIIPPVRIVKNNRIDNQLMGLILSNVRTPVEREGDFAAQLMANITGIKRIRELSDKYGRKAIAHYADALINYCEIVTRIAIEKIPDGTFEFEDILDDDGCGNENISIRTKIKVSGNSITVNFTGSDLQTDGNINTVYAVTLSSVLYVLRCLIKDDIPANAGCIRPIEIITKKGTVVDSKFPAAVAGGNVETSQRIVDTVIGALAKAIPEIAPAASQGTMNNITIGGIDNSRGRPFAYYETIAGGMGATAAHHGASAVHSHMTNTLNTPVEALEYSYPFIVTENSIRKGSGGKGCFNGGDGIIREITLTSDAEVTVISERREKQPYGLMGGNPGKAGLNTIIKDKTCIKKPGKFHEKLKKGDTIRIETPGGGGWGNQLNGWLNSNIDNRT
jgi:N-methylhydantoinase B